jgi:hypothetical protein
MARQLIEPVQVADVTLFVQRGNRKIREFKFVGDVNTGWLFKRQT